MSSTLAVTEAVLRDEPRERDHGQSPVVQLLLLVTDPQLVLLVGDVVGRAEQVARLVLVALLDEVVEGLDAANRTRGSGPCPRSSAPPTDKMGSVGCARWHDLASGWMYGSTIKPKTAAMATRPCLSSYSRSWFISASVLPLLNCKGSK